MFNPDGTQAFEFVDASSRSDLAVAPDGRIVAANTGDGRIQVFHPNGTLDFAFESDMGGDARRTVAVAPDGRIVAASTKGDGRIQVFHPNGTLDRASSVEHTPAQVDGRISSNLAALAVSPLDGRVLVADHIGDYPQRCRIQAFHLNGTFVSELRPDWRGSCRHINLAVSPLDGRIVAAYSDTNRLSAFHPNGTLDYAFGSYGGGDRQFYKPSGVAVAPDGRILVADAGNDRIQVFHPNGTLALSIIESEADVRGQLQNPTSVAVAPDGRIVVADTGPGSGRIHVFHPNGTLVSAFATESGSDGTYRMFRSPTAVAVAPNGRIVVEFQSAGRVYHPDGSIDYSFGANGTGTHYINSRVLIDVAPDGRIVVANGGGRPILHVLHSNGTIDFRFGEPAIARTTTGHVYSTSIAVGSVVASPPPTPIVVEPPPTPIVVEPPPPPPNPVPLVLVGEPAPAEPCRIVAGQLECGPPRPVVESGMIVVARGSGISAFYPNTTFAFNLVGGYSGPDSVAVAPDGRIVLSHTYKSISVLRPDGALDFGFGGGYDGHFVRLDGEPSHGILDVAVSPLDGRIVVAERDEHRIHVFHPNGTRDPAFGPPGAYPTVFNFPTSVAVSPLDGRIVVADRSRIHVFHPDGTRAFEFAGESGRQADLAVAPDGRIVAVDSNGRIQVFNPDGTLDFGFEAAGGGAKPVVAVAPDGRIVFAGTGDGRIQVFNPDGTLDLASSVEHTPAQTVGRIGPHLYGFAVSPLDGRILVMDRSDSGGPCRIQAFHPDGTFDSELVDLHRCGGVLAVSPLDGRILVVDRSRIQVFNPDGRFDFGFVPYGEDGGRFDGAEGVAVSPLDGRIWVADYSRIQVFHPNGTFDFKINSSALPDRDWWDPYGVAVAPDGRIVVADDYGYIWAFHPDGTLDFGFEAVAGVSTNPYDTPSSVAVAPDGRIVVGFLGVGHVYHPNGTLSHSFWNGGGDVAVAPDGRIVGLHTGTGRDTIIHVLHPNGTLDFAFGEHFVAASDNGVRPSGIAVASVTAPLLSPTVVIEPGGSSGDGMHNYTSVGDAADLTIDVAGLVAPAPSPGAAPGGGGGSEPRTVVFPPRETAVVTSFAEVSFPPGVTASHVPADGRLALRISAVVPPDEQVQRDLAYAGSGRVVPQKIVEVGGFSVAGPGRVTFDQPVRILLEGQAGGRAFYIQGADGKITPIDAACAADDTARVHRQLGGAGECWVDTADGNDKIIYTYHFTRFGTVLSESGAPPPVVHTCSARLGTTDLTVDARPGEYSPSVRQDLINSGSTPFVRVDLEASPWRVVSTAAAGPAGDGAPFLPAPAPGAGEGRASSALVARLDTSLPAVVSEVSTAGAGGEYTALANGTAVAGGLEGGGVEPLWFRLNLTPYGEVQGSALVQYVTYLAQCSR